MGGSGNGRRSTKKHDGTFSGTTWRFGKFNFSSSLDNLRRFVNRVFANEVGALSTSRILAVSSHMHLLHSMFIIFLLSIYTVLGKNFYALALTFVAVVNSSGAMDIGVLEYDELQKIADEISICNWET